VWRAPPAGLGRIFCGRSRKLRKQGSINATSRIRWTITCQRSPLYNSAEAINVVLPAPRKACTTLTGRRRWVSGGHLRPLGL